MRVIAGKAKGHRLRAPRGMVTRPATDLVKGAIFSILENTTSHWDRVLDLFSGSGALGIEALSRGAGWVDFVDRRPICCSIIKENLEKTKFTEQAHVYCCNVAKAFTFLEPEYNIILMDPPYPDSSIGNLLLKLANTELVGDNTSVVVTYSPHRSMESQYSTLSLVKEHRHGDSCIALYRKEEAP